MTTTTVLVQNIPSAQISVEAELNESTSAVRPSSAAHVYNSAGEIGSANPLNVTLPSGQEAPLFQSTSGSGATSAGYVSITIANAGTSAGTVNSNSLPAGTSVTWRASPGKTLAAINYNATGTTFLIAGTQ